MLEHDSHQSQKCCLSKLLRYYALNTAGIQLPPLTWLRYSTFLLLYPAGVSGGHEGRSCGVCLCVCGLWFWAYTLEVQVNPLNKWPFRKKRKRDNPLGSDFKSTIAVDYYFNDLWVTGYVVYMVIWSIHRPTVSSIHSIDLKTWDSFWRIPGYTWQNHQSEEGGGYHRFLWQSSCTLHL